MKEILARLPLLLSDHSLTYDHRPLHPGLSGLSYEKECNILLEKYKAIYFPVPKAASTSLKILFSDAIGMKPPIPQRPEAQAHKRNFPCAKRWRIAHHYADYYKFAVVRNPYSRILSCFNNKIHAKPTNNPSFINGVHRGFHKSFRGRFSCGMTFDDFLEVIATIPDEEADAHFRSQWTFLVDRRGNFLVDYLVKFESLSEELRYVFDKVNLPAADLPHMLKSDRKADWSRQFSERGKQLVLERYAKDFELLGYESLFYLLMKFLKRKLGM